MLLTCDITINIIAEAAASHMLHAAATFACTIICKATVLSIIAFVIIAVTLVILQAPPKLIVRPAPRRINTARAVSGKQRVTLVLQEDRSISM